MSLSKNDLSHTAKLANLELKEEEAKEIAKDLSAVLDFVSQLQEVKIKEDISEEKYLTENDLREDKAMDCDKKERDNALQQSSYYKDGEIVVKRILK